MKTRLMIKHFRMVYSLRSVQFFISLLLMTAPFSTSMAQVGKGKKEEISITSSFKPSIVKTGKIEFDAKVPTKDTTPYAFNYPFEPFKYTTSLSPFTVKPLALVQQLDTPVTGSFAKLGFGSLQSPFVSLSHAAGKGKTIYAAGLDHFSAKGEIADQKISQTSLFGSLKNNYSENQSLAVDMGYDRQSFKLYGYDHTVFNLSGNDIQQDFNTIHLGATYRQVTGTEGQSTFAPGFHAYYLLGSRKTNEFSANFNLPLTISLANNLFLHAQLDVSHASLRDTAAPNRAATLVQLPLQLSFKTEKFQIKGGVSPVFDGNKFGIAPQFKFLYNVNDKGLRFKAGLSNAFELNSLQKLSKLNPFLVAPDSIKVFRQSDYYIGLDWVNQKGLQFNFSLGMTQFRNIPLFVNAGFTERQFKVLNESLLSAFSLSGGLEYVFDETLKFRTDLKYYAFTDQKDQDHPFGILPMELKSNISWNPIDPLTLRFNAYLWRGTMALPVSNGNVGGGFPAFQLKDAADLSFGVDYKLIKNWALWVDLNNIANVRYQRWNKYESFGFNFIGGVRYVFNTPNK